MNRNDEGLGGNLALLAKMGGETADIQLWTDGKKQDFVNTFHARARVAQYILQRTAERIQEIALSRHFISQRHVVDYRNVAVEFDPLLPGENQYSGVRRCGGRELAELNEIAFQRAKAILAELPAARRAVEIIRPDVAKMMDRRDKLKEKGQKLADALRDMSGTVKLADLDQDMTIGEFRRFVKERKDRQDAMLKELNEIGDEGTTLENKIAKELYAGLPGLSDAVIKVIKQHRERVVAMAQTRRRVEERVKFGDSTEALAILQGFEKDEIEVSNQVKAEFGLALQTLKLAGQKRRSKK